MIAETIAEPLKLDLTRAAWGIHEIINEDVARAFRIHASERGFDYRQSSMVAFGGSGPLHAMAVARILKIPRVVFPIGAGVMSALGLLASPLAFELSQSRLAVIDDLDRDSRRLVTVNASVLRTESLRDRFARFRPKRCRARQLNRDRKPLPLTTHIECDLRFQ